MSDHLTKIIGVACLFLLSSPLSSQVIIRDSVTIAPRNTLLLPKGVVAYQPVVDVSFVSSSESLFPGALIQIQMPDKKWTMIAAPCTGVDSALLQADMGIFPETGQRIGEVLYSSCYGDMGGYLSYSEYFSPPYGGSTGVSVDLIGVGPNIRYLGYFDYFKPPLPTVAITTTPDSPDLGSLYISDNYQPTIEFTEEHTPNLGERFEPTIEWLTTQTINTGDYLEQVRSQGHVSIPIAVKATNVSGIATDTIWVTLLGIDRFSLVPDSQSVDHGQSVYFSVQALDIYGNVIDNYYNPESGDDYPYNIPLTITWNPNTLGEVEVPPQASIARRNNGLALNDSKKQSFHSPGNISSPKNGTVKVGSNIAATKPITNFPKSESGKGQIQKLQSSSDTTISSLNCTYWNAQYLQFVADGQSPDNPTPVTITVTSADGYNRTGIGHVVVNPVLPCGTVILSSAYMNPGDTIDVTIKIKINDTTFADYPEGTLFNIGITDDGDYGLLLANGETAPSFDDVTMPIKFIAADSIDVDSTIVLFRGSPEKGSSVSGIAGKSRNKLMLTQAYKPKKGGKKFLAVADNSTCSGPTAETIRKQIPIVLQIISPLENQLLEVNITEDPKMPPDMKVKAQLKNYTGSANFLVSLPDVQWTAPHSGGRITHGYFDNGDGTQGSNIVEIPFVYPDGYIRGGDKMTLSVKAVVGDKIYTATPIDNPYKILGKNPSKNAILTALNGDIYAAVAWQESRFNQFAHDAQYAIAHPLSTTPDYPVQGDDPTDYGLMQIHSASDDVIWNWRTNIQAGLDNLNGRLKVVITYNMDPEFLDTDPKPLALSQDQQLFEAYCEYNGGPGAWYWGWVPGDLRKGESGKWEKQKQSYQKSIKYADIVHGIFISIPHPWDKYQ